MNTTDTIDIAPPQPARRWFNFPALMLETRQAYVGFCIILWSILAYLFISHFIMMRVEIKGASMWPTLLDGQRYILYRCPYLFRSPQKGEIVVIRDPEDHDFSIKRVVAVPGETVEIRRSGVYINNTKLPEPYLTSFSAYASGNRLIKAHRLGPNDFFVLGDNRDRSADSRIYGAVPRDSILGCIHKTD